MDGNFTSHEPYRLAYGDYYIAAAQHPKILLLPSPQVAHRHVFPLPPLLLQSQVLPSTQNSRAGLCS